MDLIIAVSIILFIFILFYLARYYNVFTVLQLNCERAWGDIDVQLQRRYDLISRLVEIVRDFAGHEHKTLTNVVEARSRAISAKKKKNRPKKRKPRDCWRGR